MKRILYAALLLFTALQAQAQYKSLLWKITGKDLKEPSYLFGTMHTGDARILEVGKTVAQPYVDKTKAYVMELDPESGFDMSIVQKLMMGGNYSLAKMIPDNEYAFLDSIVTKQVGISMAMFDNVAPIFVLTIFETMSMGLNEQDAKDTQPAEVLDLYLYNYAKDHGKHTAGIETVDEQLKALQALNYNEQAKILSDEIDSFRLAKNAGTDIVDFYLKQDLDSLLANGKESKMPDRLYKALVFDRNQRMANRIPAIIKSQSTLIAIGALHLPGENGVIELLRKKGFKVEAVR